MITGWARATKIMATVALAAIAALAIGCGPAPGYEPEPASRWPTRRSATRASSSIRSPSPRRTCRRGSTRKRQNDPNAENVQAAHGRHRPRRRPTQYSDTDPSALTEFKPALDGHGQWVDDPTYGTVWVPSEAEVGTDFVPYSTAGHWTYADDTNYVWVSDYSWGWAPFHYGRWAHVGRHGWVWIPGRTYAGAWVDLALRRTATTTSAGLRLGPEWYWYDGYAVGWGWGWSPYYSYCHHDHFYDSHVGGYVVCGNDPRAREHEAHTRPYVAAAPAVAAVVALPRTRPSAAAVASQRRRPSAVSARSVARVAGPAPAQLGIRTTTSLLLRATTPVSRVRMRSPLRDCRRGRRCASLDRRSSSRRSTMPSRPRPFRAAHRSTVARRS